MPKFTVVVPHRINQFDALRRIQGLLGEVKSQFADKIRDLEERWEGNTGTFGFTAMGFSIAGTLKVEHDQVELHGTLPWAAMPFRGKIETTIRERAQALLA